MLLVLKLFLGFYLLKSSSSAGLDCAEPQFEKVIGLRPSSRVYDGILFRITDNSEGITTECLRQCKQSSRCTGFVLFYQNATCIRITESDSNISDEENVYDIDAAWFRKTCYKANTCNSSWIIERIPAATLIGNDTKKLPSAISRANCQEYCLNESDFVCRSAKFHAQPINSVASNYYYYTNPQRNGETLGECVLSNSDRYESPSGFRVSGYDEEYFENQCTNSVIKEFCAFEEYENVILSHIDATYRNFTKQQCQTECEKFPTFKCRGFSIIPSQRMAMRNPLFSCFIHSENTKVFGPKSLRDHPGGTYYERAPCLNISVQCFEEEMRILFDSETQFNGKLYMKGFSESPECYALGNRSHHVELSIPLEVNKCGIGEVRSPDNRTLFSTTMILQYNSLVQTQADRIIKVGCIFTNSSNVLVGTGFNFTDDLSGSNTGTNVINQTSNLPTVEMRIKDLSSNEISNTEIGDELQLIIEMQPANSGYDIWAGHLVAMTENGEDSILLLDDRGCPTNLDVFPALKRIADEKSVKLTATFQAFKFSSSNVIRFSVMVQFCVKQCPKPKCGGETFYPRNKRDIIQQSTGQIKDVDRTQFQAEGAQIVNRMPLEFVLIVRNVNSRPDKLVYGENNKILVAGYDYLNNEVCLDFSLLIGLIVLWLLIQVILLVSCFILIKRYKRYYENQYLNESIEELHKNFGLGFSNLDAHRRVRFEDSQVLT